MSVSTKFAESRFFSPPSVESFPSWTFDSFELSFALIYIFAAPRFKADFLCVFNTVGSRRHHVTLLFLSEVSVSSTNWNIGPPKSISDFILKIRLRERAAVYWVKPFLWRTWWSASAFNIPLAIKNSHPSVANLLFTALKQTQTNFALVFFDGKPLKLLFLGGISFSLALSTPTEPLLKWGSPTMCAMHPSGYASKKK